MPGPELIQKLAEYGILVTILAVFIFATYKKVWVPGKDLRESEDRHQKEIAIMSDAHNREVGRLITDRDRDIARMMSEIDMWRQLALREIDHGKSRDHYGDSGSKE